LTIGPGSHTSAGSTGWCWLIGGRGHGVDFGSEKPRLEWVDFESEFGSEHKHDEEIPSGGPMDTAGFVRELTALADACRNGDRVRRVCCGMEVLLHNPGLSDPENGLWPRLLPADLGYTGMGDTVLRAIAASPQLACFIKPDPPPSGRGSGKAHDPVAPAPDLEVAIHHNGDRTKAVPIAVALQVHPVSPPAFAVLRRGQQSIDRLLVSVGRGIGEEGV
jgi:hypothetical protein